MGCCVSTEEKESIRLAEVKRRDRIAELEAIKLAESKRYAAEQRYLRAAEDRAREAERQENIRLLAARNARLAKERDDKQRFLEAKCSGCGHIRDEHRKSNLFLHDKGCHEFFGGCVYRWPKEALAAVAQGKCCNCKHQSHYGRNCSHADRKDLPPVIVSVKISSDPDTFVSKQMTPIEEIFCPCKESNHFYGCSCDSFKT